MLPISSSRNRNSIPPLALLILFLLLPFMGFSIEDPKEVGKRVDKIQKTHLQTCGGCNPVLAAIRDKDVRRCLRNAYMPGYTITPVIDFQVGCFGSGCFTRINFIKSVRCDFPPCSAAPDILVATVEIGCDCEVETLQCFDGN